MPSHFSETDEPEPFDVEVEREQIRELNERSRAVIQVMSKEEFRKRYPDSAENERRRLKWEIALGLVVLLAWGWFFRYVYRLIYS